VDLQPTLEGERLLLRPLRHEDREALYAVARDPEIWALHPDRERWRADAFAAYFDSLLDRGGSLAVIDRPSGGLIGVSRFQFGRPDDGGTIEIGSTMLARSHWGGAANREMKRLMVAHALRYVATVEFWVGEDNLRSQRAMEKLGARLTDRRERPEIAGRTVPHLVCGISRDEFARGPLGSTGD